MKKYKVLTPDLTSPFQNFQYEIGKEYICKDFDSNPKVECSNGFYATDIDGVPYSWNVRMKLFEVEVGGKQVIFNQYKQRFEKQTIIREVLEPEIRELARSVDVGYNLEEVLFPIDPRKITVDLSQKHIDLLKVWASVGDSVRDSVWAYVGASVGASVRDSVWAYVRDSVWAYVGASVRNSVWASVGASVRASVGASVWAYISSIFNIQEWKYVSHDEGVNPFQSAIDLWKDGFVPSFDGAIWRLHQGENMDIVYELKI